MGEGDSNSKRYNSRSPQRPPNNHHNISLRMMRVAHMPPGHLHHGLLSVGPSALLLGTDDPIKRILLHDFLDSGNSLVCQRFVLEHCRLLAPRLLVPSEQGEWMGRRTESEFLQCAAEGLGEHKVHEADLKGEPAAVRDEVLAADVVEADGVDESGEEAGETAK